MSSIWRRSPTIRAASCSRLRPNRSTTPRACAAPRWPGRPGSRRYLLPSSCSVYGFQDPQVVCDEGHPAKPLTTYAKANLAAEQGVLPLAGERFCVTVLRQATLYGYSPRMRFDLAINGMTCGAWRNRVLPLMPPVGQRQELGLPSDRGGPGVRAAGRGARHLGPALVGARATGRGRGGSRPPDLEPRSGASRPDAFGPARSVVRLEVHRPTRGETRGGSSIRTAAASSARGSGFERSRRSAGLPLVSMIYSVRGGVSLALFARHGAGSRSIGRPEHRSRSAHGISTSARWTR